MKEDHNESLEETLRKKLSNVEVEGPEQTWVNISQKLHSPQLSISIFTKYRKYLVAASIVSMIGILAFFISNNKYEKQITKHTPADTASTKVVYKGHSSNATIEKEPSDTAQHLATTPSSKNIPSSTVVTLNIITLKTTHEKKFLLLPDSSKVILNKNSMLSYNEDFNKKERSIQVEGEAYFTISKDSQKPFVIESLRSNTKVLGTSFNLRAYPTEDFDELEVVEGLVEYSLKDLSKTIRLSKGKIGKIIIKNNEPLLSKSEATNTNSLAWKSEKMIFKKTPFSEVISSVERYFDKKFIVENPDILKCTFSGTFDKPQLPELLQVVAMTGKISYKEENKKIILSGEGCK